ncbi:DUF2489 domain-containing protein [Marinobacterium sediminicola]|uniref:DUF2489 domain-containing protein n=1 Tax=Marinobacterium sediminicola TaxID=518898 RepID=A0ABY1S2L5_9GAMM|nr:DUF2489 domain-containing protein [Marinobacterium sediminicola]ULG68871.1 DUF2489 domain-containing protein [Marinobacterium sediminicola]SMR77519.1 Protein of unknown function [Marinobacterium sediminicola]
MSNTLIYSLIAIGLLAIVILSAVIYRQLSRARARQQQQAAREAAALAALEERHQYLQESIRLVAGAILHDEKMTLTEGCIRLKVLLENFRPQLLQQEAYAVITEVHDRTSHIPIKEEWQALPKKLKREYQQEMEALEAEHQEAVNAIARELSSGEPLK